MILIDFQIQAPSTRIWRFLKPHLSLPGFVSGRIFSPGAGGILSDRHDQMGEKIKTPKNISPNFRISEFPSHKKIPESIKWSNYHESSDCFEYPKKCLPKSSCPKFSYPKKSRNRKFQIQTFWIVAQFLARKPVNFASLLTDSFIVLVSKFLKLWTWMQTHKTAFRPRKVTGTFEKQAPAWAYIY